MNSNDAQNTPKSARRKAILLFEVGVLEKRVGTTKSIVEKLNVCEEEMRVFSQEMQRYIDTIHTVMEINQPSNETIKCLENPTPLYQALSNLTFKFWSSSSDSPVGQDAQQLNDMRHDLRDATSFLTPQCKMIARVAENNARAIEIIESRMSKGDGQSTRMH